MNWKKVLTIIIGIIVFIIWTYVPEDEYEDPDEKFSVTFTYDCRNIILMFRNMLLLNADN